MTRAGAAGRSALALGAVALVLGVAEMVARYVEMPPRLPLANSCPDPAGLLRLEDFGKPNVRGAMTCNVPYRTNRYGFRGPDMPLRKRPRTVRIVIGGDSVTMGSGVREPETYAAQLEGLLDGLHPGTHQVLNLGVAGLSIRHVVDRIESIGLRFDPDLIVYGWTLNDIEGSHYVPLASPEEKRALIANSFRFAHSPSRLIANVWPKIVDLFSSRDIAYATELRNNYREDTLAWAEFTSELDRLSEIRSERDRCVVVFLHTHLYALDRGHEFLWLYDQVKAAAHERDLFTVGSFDLHEGREARSLWVRVFDLHPNSAGHELLARALAKGIRELPPRCWKSTTPPWVGRHLD